MLFRAKRLRYKPSRAEGYSLLIEFHLSVSVRMFFPVKNMLLQFILNSVFAVLSLSLLRDSFFVRLRLLCLRVSGFRGALENRGRGI